MFFVKKLRRDILLQPAHLGPRMHEHIMTQILEEVEGKCLGKHGYVIRVLSLDDATILPGLIDNDSGCVNVTVIYQAIMLRPFKNEVVDATIFNAADDSGFFARVGPLEIFIHKFNMPEDTHFDMNAGDAWVSEDGTIEIKDGSVVRLRIIGVSVDAGQMNAIGTIKDAYLGQLE
jgi:DNA-directed RNA polymerase II subunit RPB7